MLSPYYFYWFRIDNKYKTEPWLDQALLDRHTGVMLNIKTALQTALTHISNSFLPITHFKLLLEISAVHFEMYMTRATKKYKSIDEAKPKIKAVWHFKNMITNFPSCLDLSTAGCYKKFHFTIPWPFISSSLVPDIYILEL